MGSITVDLGVEVLVLSVFSKPGAPNPAQTVQFKLLDDQGKVVAKTDPARRRELGQGVPHQLPLLC